MNHTIAEIDPTKAAEYEAIVIDLLKTEYPTLDLRVGTGLRDVLVRPDASLLGVASMDNTDLQAQMALSLMTDNSDPAIVSAVASNLGVTQRAGVAASGKVMVETTVDQAYYIPTNMYFTYSSKQYNVTQSWQVVPTTSDPLTLDPNTQVQIQVGSLVAGVQSYYFLLPVAAAAPGTEYNVLAGTLLTAGLTIGYGVTTVSVYSDIYGGEDAETVTQFVARVPQAMGIRTMESDRAISANLMEQFPGVKDVAVIGMGAPEMLRDRHNVFGASAGGKIDVYVRMSSQPDTITIVKTGIRQPDGTYQFTIGMDSTGHLSDEAPGMYLIRNITSPQSPLTYEPLSSTYGEGNPMLGSYPFSETRLSGYTGNALHDIVGVAEVYYTRWQQVQVSVSGTGLTADSAQFRIELYLPKTLADIQAYVDRDDVRNRNADTVVRGAVPCFVSAVVRISKAAAASVDSDAMKTSMVNYINGKKFGDTVTVSQLSAIAHQYDIISMGVDSQHGIQLQGRVLGTDGVFYSVGGSVLDINNIKNVSAGISPNTVVFFADPININIEGI